MKTDVWMYGKRICAVFPQGMSRPHLWVWVYDAARESTMFIQIESFMSFEVYHIRVSIHSNSISSSTVGYGYLMCDDI